MIVRVKYPNGKFDMVRAFRLDYLIETKTIHSFERSSGWVVLGVDPIRQPGKRSQHRAPERRVTAPIFEVRA